MLKRVLTISAIPLVVAAMTWLLLVRPMNRPLPIWAGGPVSKPPVVSFWDRFPGNVLPTADYKRIPEPLVVVWEDGTVVRLVPDPTTEIAIQMGARENGDSARYKGDKLKMFRTSPAEVKKLVGEAAKAGWFSRPAGTGGLLVPDACVMLLEVRDGQRRRTYTYHGYDKLNFHYGPGHVPPDEEVDAFVMMWNTVRTAISKVPLTEVGDYTGTPPIERPHD